MFMRAIDGVKKPCMPLRVGLLVRQFGIRQRRVQPSPGLSKRVPTRMYLIGAGYRPFTKPSGRAVRVLWELFSTLAPILRAQTRMALLRSCSLYKTLDEVAQGQGKRNCSSRKYCGCCKSGHG